MKDNVNRRFAHQIGVYCLDVNNSDGSLKAYYGSLPLDSLQLTFNPDGSFVFNFSVPFIRDSIGTWTVGNHKLYKWNYMHFQNSKSVGGQLVTQCCDSDSSIRLHSTTPRIDQIAIHKISFVKCQ